MGVVHFLVCKVLEHNILEEEVALKIMSADVEAVLYVKEDSKEHMFI